MRLASLSLPALRRLCLGAALLCAVCHLRADLVPWPALGFNLARGFQISLYADNRLADDIYSMTVNASGNVVVSGPGYIRTLIDDDDDGVADRAVLFGNTPSGCMGMCFSGNDLLFVADGALWRLRDSDGDGQADGAPERFLSLDWGEHGGHAVRRGPDGSFYILAGNDAKLDPAQFSLGNLPVGHVEGGALLRLKRNGGGIELLAHGFRNPYDFDFNADGDLFTYDSDAERDFALPWYLPTRFYHIPYGGHHGWRLEGHARSWPRAGHDLDSVEAMAATGRGSPTGITFYRHVQFPEYYTDGLFAADWTFGRVYFVSAQPEGSTWRGRPEIFLESTGDHGFAPTDVVVGRNGELFVSTGGRKTRGAVYRIRYADMGRWGRAVTWWTRVSEDIAALIAAPQPFEAWSRWVWQPAAEGFGTDPFQRVAVDENTEPGARIRALEILTDVFEGVDAGTAAACARATSPRVRARVAWAISVKPPENLGPLLLGLARDTASQVRVAALDGLLQHEQEVDLSMRQQALAVNLAHPDKRVRQAAARLAAGLPDPAWLTLWGQQQGGLPQARLTMALAMNWRDRRSQVNTSVVETALAVLTASRAPELREQALRLIHLGLGDYHLENPSVELYTAYEPAQALTGLGGLTRRLQRTLAALLPSGDAAVDAEVARLLAVMAADDPAVPAKVMARCSRASTATSDLHYLIVFSRLKAPTVTNLTSQVANTLLGLEQKLGAISQRPQQAWADRFLELTRALVQQNPRLADALARHPDLARASHLSIVPLLGPQRYLACARLFWNAVQRQPSFPWSTALIDLLSALPPEETHPLLRRQLANVTLRERLLLELSSRPNPDDREHYLAGLASPRSDVVRACLSALLLLPPDPGGRTAPAALRLLRSLLRDPGDRTARAQVLALLSRQTGQKFTVQERPDALAASYQPVFDWFFTRHPALAQQLDADDKDTPARWEPVLRSAPWTKGRPERGETLYQQRGCQNCHDGPQPLGPDLGGVAQRLGSVELMRAILFPSRDVAPAYRMTTFRTRDGQSHTGLVAAESADGVILRAGPDLTLRLAEADIVGREPSAVSFMPGGLLAGLTGQDLADLAAYLHTLAPAQ